MALNLVMLGPPGAGKGTQASRLAQSRGVPHISTGEILREAVQAGTDELVRRLSTRRMCESCGAITGSVNGRPTATCGTCGGALKQRSDDREDVVRQRLIVYRQRTEPLIGYYQQRPTFRSIDGSQDEEAVAALVGAAVDGVAA